MKLKKIIGKLFKKDLSVPLWAKQKDLFFKCPKCGKLRILPQLPNGNTVLTELYSIETVNSIILSCPCGGVINLFSKETILTKFICPINWETEFSKFEK